MKMSLATILAAIGLALIAIATGTLHWALAVPGYPIAGIALFVAGGLAWEAAASYWQTGNWPRSHPTDGQGDGCLWLLLIALGTFQLVSWLVYLVVT